jgi:hypothetical protein
MKHREWAKKQYARIEELTSECAKITNYYKIRTQERDAWQEEAERIQAERDRHASEKKTLLSETLTLKEENRKLTAERDQLHRSECYQNMMRDNLRSERDGAIEQADQFRRELSELRTKYKESVAKLEVDVLAIRKSRDEAARKIEALVIGYNLPVPLA